jgi:TPR repeat protein
MAILFAGACAGPAQAAPGGAADPSQGGKESRLRQGRIGTAAAAPRPGAAQVESAKQKPAPAKRSSRPAAGPRTQIPAPSAAQVQELTRLSGAQIRRRIAAQRRILRRDPKNEAARQAMALIAVELGNRILDLDALDRRQEITGWMRAIREDLHDTFWRSAQLARTDARSAAALGLFYSEGMLTPRAPEKGCTQYARAARQGHLGARYRAALCATRADPEQAKAMLLGAAEQGHAGAQELIGRACIEGETKDRACAFEWLGRAAAQGRPSALSLLAWLYASDPGRADLAKALSYYRKAAAAGDQAAQNNLGELHETGRGVAQDAAQAYGWYARAAQAGFAPAQLNLARLYAAGAGVARDTAQARLWAERAQKQGETRAQQLLDWLEAQR